jgi:aryl-alcohol dehydrogenase-like predicted oxidoreductase
MPPRFILGLMGSSPSGGASALSTPAQLTALLKLALKHNILDLDTARAYSNENGSAEALLGSVDKALTSQFRIDTKAPAFMPGSLTKEKILENYKLSVEALGVTPNIYYLHGHVDLPARYIHALLTWHLARTVRQVSKNKLERSQVSRKTENASPGVLAISPPTKYAKWSSEHSKARHNRAVSLADLSTVTATRPIILGLLYTKAL